MRVIRRGAWIGATAAMLALGQTASAQESVTMVTSGGSYMEAMRTATYVPASKLLGITIKEDSIRSWADVRLQVQSGKPTWDIVEYAIQFCKSPDIATLYEPIDYSVVTNAGDLPAEYKGSHWVGGTTVYSMVLAWSKRKYGNNPPAGWADFFDVAKFPGTRALYAQPRFMLEVAALADGVPMDKIYPLDVDKSIKKVGDFSKNVTVFYETHGQAAQLLTNGEIDMMAILNGRVDAVIKDGAPVDYTFNQGITDAGCLGVLKGAPNVKGAMKVINALLDKDIQANIPQEFAYAPINPKAFATGRIPEAKAKFLPSYPPNASRMLPMDAGWWGANQAEVDAKWRRMRQN